MRSAQARRLPATGAGQEAGGARPIRDRAKGESKLIGQLLGDVCVAMRLPVLQCLQERQRNALEIRDGCGY